MDTPVNTIECTNKASLFLKMSAVMGELSRIPKNGTNAKFGYKFATESDVADAVRTAMAKHKLAMFPNMVSATKEGKMLRGVFEFTLACGDTGATQTCRWESEVSVIYDGDDKGINKLATAAEKYFLLKTFIIGTGDEPDPDADETPEPPAKAQYKPAYIDNKPTPDEVKRQEEYLAKRASKPVAQSELTSTAETTSTAEIAPETPPELNPFIIDDINAAMKKYGMTKTDGLAFIEHLQLGATRWSDLLQPKGKYTLTYILAQLSGFKRQAALPMDIAAMDMQNGK